MSHMFSCAPSWKEPEYQSYGTFLLILGFMLPLAIILLTSVASVRTISRVSLLGATAG